MNDTAFILFGLEIKWYAIIIVSGMLLALLLFMFLCSKRSIITDKTNYLLKSRSLDNEFCLAMFIFAIVFAVIGARIVFVVPRWIKYGMDYISFFDFRTGGLTIIGAIPFGAAGILLCCLIYKKSPFRVIDLVVPCMLLGQVIGRWGNFVNGELYGMEITVEWLQFFPMAVEINGKFFAANFFYEMVLNFIGMCIALALIYKYGERLKTGFLTVGYLMWYGLVRGTLEFLKVDPLRWGSVKAVQLICYLVVPVCIVIIILLQRGVISFETQKMYRLHFKEPLEPPELKTDLQDVGMTSSELTDNNGNGGIEV